MLEKLKCKTCGKIFIAEHSQGRPPATCSPPCALVLKRRRAKEAYKRRTPEQNARWKANRKRVLQAQKENEK